MSVCKEGKSVLLPFDAAWSWSPSTLSVNNFRCKQVSEFDGIEEAQTASARKWSRQFRQWYSKFLGSRAYLRCLTLLYFSGRQALFRTVFIRSLQFITNQSLPLMAVTHKGDVQNKMSKLG